VARHLPGQVLAHELARAFHQHCGPDRIQSANTDVITAYARLDLAKLWGDGPVVAADGSPATMGDNALLAETLPPQPGRPTTLTVPAVELPSWRRGSDRGMSHDGQ
jgi:TnpA family transposase